VVIARLYPTRNVFAADGDPGATRQCRERRHHRDRTRKEGIVGLELDMLHHALVPNQLDEVAAHRVDMLGGLAAHAVTGIRKG
jgi:hypothetical protein